MHKNKNIQILLNAAEYLLELHDETRPSADEQIRSNREHDPEYRTFLGAIHEAHTEIMRSNTMNSNDPYMTLRDALHNVHFELQLDMKEMSDTDPMHDWSTDPDMLAQQQQFHVFENMAKAIEELLFPRTNDSEEEITMNEDTRYTVQGHSNRPRRIQSVNEQEIRDELRLLTEQKSTIIGRWQEDILDNQYFDWFMNPDTVKIEQDTDINDHGKGITVYWVDIEVLQIRPGGFLCQDHGYDTPCFECQKNHVGEPFGGMDLDDDNN